MREPNNAIVHFYRAAVMHTDVWRRRTDATTNWAVVSTAALITFSFSDPKNPHFILLVGLAFDIFFLVMESRRYQVLQRWRLRVHQMNRWVIAPHLSPSNAPTDEEIEVGLAALAKDLGNTTPKISLLQAMGYRTRRNYGFVFMVVLLTWLLKLWYHPAPGGDMIERAAVGVVPGGIVLTAVLFTAIALTFTAFYAPSEAMENWEELGSPMDRITKNRPVLMDSDDD